MSHLFEDKLQQHIKEMISQYEKLLTQMMASTTPSEVKDFAAQIQDLLKAIHEAMLDFYQKQTQAHLSFIESQKGRFESRAQKTLADVQSSLSGALHQSQSLLQAQVKTLKNMGQENPAAAWQKAMQQATDAFQTQGKAWQALYQEQQTALKTDMQAFEAQANTLRENAEKLRNDLMHILQSLQTRFQESLKQKGGPNKPKM